MPYFSDFNELDSANRNPTRGPTTSFMENAGAAFDRAMPWRPRRAFEAMADAPILRRYLGGAYLDAYAACKLAEIDAFEAEPSPLEYRYYLQPD